MGEKARTLINDSFTFDTTVAQMKKVYEEILA